MVESTSCAVEQEETSGGEEGGHIDEKYPPQTGVFALVDTSGHRGQAVQTVGMNYLKGKMEMVVDLQQLI